MRRHLAFYKVTKYRDNAPLSRTFLPLLVQMILSFHGSIPDPLLTRVNFVLISGKATWKFQLYCTDLLTMYRFKTVSPL